MAEKSNTLRVLILSPDPRVHGGVSTFIETMKPHLKHCSVESCWVGSIQGEKETALAVLGRVISAAFQLWRLLRRKTFDVVHINPSLGWKSFFRDGLNLMAIRYAGHRQTLIYFHGWDWGIIRHLRWNIVLRIWFVHELRFHAAIMVLAPEFKDALVRMGIDASRIHVTRTMFDSALLAHAVPEKNILSRRTILFMSRFVRAKGVYELVNAFAALAEQFTDVDLIMAGEGEESQALREHVEQLGLTRRILFPGYITGTEKFALLHACTIYALPTYFPEGMPVALLEAMAAGKPVLTAKEGCIPHIIHEPDNGIVLSKVTVDTVRQALVRMLEDPAYCEATGARNRVYAFERFEASRVTAEIETMYGTIAGH